MSTRPQWLSGAHPLASELWTIRTRSIKDLRNDPNDPIPSIARLAENLFELAVEESKRKKIFTLLNAAIPILADEEQRRAAHRLFDLTLGSRVLPLYKRQENAGQEFNPTVTQETFGDNREKGRQYEQRLILDLTEVILNLHRHLRGQPRLRLGERILSEFEAQPCYVSRPEVDLQLERALSENHPVVLLVGDAGVGKARLAEEACLRLTDGNPSQVAVIKQYSGQLSYEEMYSQLYQRGIKRRGETITAFAEMLTTSSAPRFVILAHVTDIAAVNQLILPGMRSTLLITSTQQVATGAYTIRVPSLSTAQASTLVRSILDNVTNEDIQEIVTASDGRPRLIKDLCEQLIENRFDSAKELAESIVFQPQLFFELAEPDWQRRLTTHYAHILDTLRVESPTSALLLELLGMCTANEVKEPALALLLGGLLAVDGNTMMNAVTKESARRLEARSIATIEADTVRINRLTKVIIQDLLGDRKAIIGDNIFTLLDAGLAYSSSHQDLVRFGRWRYLFKSFMPDDISKRKALLRHPDPRPVESRIDDRWARALPGSHAHISLDEYTSNVGEFLVDLEAVNLAVS